MRHAVDGAFDQAGYMIRGPLGDLPEVSKQRLCRTFNLTRQHGESQSSTPKAFKSSFSLIGGLLRTQVTPAATLGC